VPPFLVLSHLRRREKNHLFSGKKIMSSAHLNALGSDNGAPPAKPTQDAEISNTFRLAAPKPIPPLRQHRLTPYPTLCASLEVYSSCSSPLSLFSLLLIIALLKALSISPRNPKIAIGFKKGDSE
jgi:hypothetical protein